MWQQIPIRTSADAGRCFSTMTCTLVSVGHCGCAERMKSLNLLHILVLPTRRSHRKQFVSESPWQVWETYRVYWLWWNIAGPSLANESCCTGKLQLQKQQYENEFSTIYKKTQTKLSYWWEVDTLASFLNIIGIRLNVSSLIMLALLNVQED